MKHGTKPSYSERKALEQAGFDPRKWLVVKKLSHTLEVVHRETGEKREVEK